MTWASTHWRRPATPSRSQSKTGASSSYTPNLTTNRGVPSACTPPGPEAPSRVHGYLVQASRVARVRLSPTEAPAESKVLASSRDSNRSVWALPSKPPQSWLSSARTRSPLWPNGGWPRSWASAAVSVMSGWQPSARARSRATCATSRLWVSRLRTKSSVCGPTTWVLAASRRDAAACTTRARSRSKAVRTGASTRLGGSSTTRARSCSSYSSSGVIAREPSDNDRRGPTLLHQRRRSPVDHARTVQPCGSVAPQATRSHHSACGSVAPEATRSHHSTQ